MSNQENKIPPSSKTKTEKIKDQKPLIKSKTLHELLKQGGGQNLVIDFSMLSKKGKLNSLIEKAKKYQNLNSPRIIEEQASDKKKEKENEEKSNKKSKISKNFEILTKFSKRKNKNDMDNKEKEEKEEKEKEININLEKELSNDLNNKINITTTDADNMDETENTYQGCLELEYDNNPSECYSSRETAKTNKNYINNNNDNIQNKKEKKVKFNINNNYNNINNYYLPYNSRYQEPEPEQPVLTQSNS